jgi:hypothetical protein
MERFDIEYGSRFDLEERRQAIWASEAPRMLGIKPSPVQLWAEKTGKAEPPDLSGIEAVQMGHVMEPVILELFKDQTGLPAKPTKAEHRQAPGLPFLKAHTDAMVAPGQIVEIKNFNQSRRKEFGDWGTDEVPPVVYVQCVHEAICWEAHTVYVPVLFGGQEFVTFKLSVSKAEKDAYIERAKKFYDAIFYKKAPEPTSADDLKILFPQEKKDAIRQTTPEILTAVERIKEIKAYVKSLEAEAEGLSDTVRVYMGEAGGLFNGSTMVASYKKAGDSSRFDTKALQAANKALYEQYVTKVPGTRRFLIK